MAANIHLMILFDLSCYFRM